MTQYVYVIFDVYGKERGNTIKVFSDKNKAIEFQKTDSHYFMEEIEFNQ